MSNKSIVPSEDSKNPIQVIGVGAEIASQITARLTQYLGDVVLSSIKGIAISFEETKVAIRITRRHAQASYIITAQEDIAKRINNALNRAENNSDLRPSIRARLMEELEQDLDEIFYQLREELKKDRDRFE